MPALADFVFANAWLWPLVSALLTLAFGALAKSESPTAKALFGVFSALGVDAPKLIDALKALFSKKAPAPVDSGDAPTLPGEKK